jgi:uncharacterized C2H2 Zn-finger protein
MAYVNYIEHVNTSHTTEIIKKWIQCPKCDVFLPDQDTIDVHVKAQTNCTQMLSRTQTDLNLDDVDALLTWL